MYNIIKDKYLHDLSIFRGRIIEAESIYYIHVLHTYIHFNEKQVFILVSLRSNCLPPRRSHETRRKK